MKHRIKITESTLHRIVKESVKRILKEWGAGDGGWSYETLHPSEEDKRKYEKKKRDEEKRNKDIYTARQACH